MNLNQKLCLTFYVVLFATILCAQKQNMTLIQAKDGLIGLDQWSSSSVARDKNGFVWFCTMSGLNRWDGYSIKSYGKISNDTRDLPNKNISAIAIDKENNLWLGTQEEGIIYFDTKRERFSHFDSQKLLKDSLDFSQINTLIIDKNNILFIATAFQGIYQYDIDKKRLSKYLDKNNLIGKDNSTFILTKNHNLVIVSSSGIYFEYLPHQFAHYPIDKKYYLNEIVEIEEGKFNVYCSNTLHHYILDIKNNNIEKANNKIAEVVVNAAIDSNKNLWTSYENGTLTKEDFITKKIEQVTLKSKLFDNEVNVGMKGMYIQGTKIYFMSLSTGAGIYDYNIPLVIPFSRLPFSNIKKIDDKIYGINTGAIYRIENNAITKIAELNNEHRSDFITDFIVTQDQGIYMGHIGQNGFISQYDSSGKQIGEALKCNTPYLFHQLQNKQIVQEFQKYNYSKKVLPISYIGDLYTRLSNTSLPDFKVKYYTEMKNGDIWIALFKGGVIRIYDNQRQYEVLPIDLEGKGKLNSNNAYYIYEHSDGTVYIATDMGINLWNPFTRTCTYLDLPKDAESKHIKGMVEDRYNKLWIHLEDNLLCYDPKKKEIYSHPLSDLYHSTAQVSRDLIIDNGGKLCIETNNGIFTFDQAAFFSSTAPSKVIFTDLYVNRKRIYPEDDYQILNQAIHLEKSIEVSYKHRDLGFSFVSIDGKEKDVTYYYRLVGYTDEWTNTKDDRTIHYTNLDPGKYVFEAKARAGNGKETTVTTIDLIVQPPWYQRWYAYLLYTLVLSSLAYITYRMRINQLLKYQSLRTKISSDLHDDVGTILTGIAMQSEMMSYEKDNEDKSLLLDLSTMSRDAMERMRDIVWALDARKDSYDDLITRMREYAEMMLSKKEIQYEFDIKIGTGLNGINPEQRQNLYFIFKEAIANIVKHSDASKVEISINKSTSETTMKIKDNGTIKKDYKYSGQGLANIKMRANRIGGDAIILNEDGFCVKVIL